MPRSHVASLLASVLLLLSKADGAESELCNPLNDVCYSAIHGQIFNWTQAQDYCSKHFPSGSLASIHSAFENSLLFSAILLEGQPNPQLEPWFGGYREENDKTFSWSDGTSFQYTNWAVDYPTPRGSQCIKFCHSGSSNCQPLTWKTAPCNTESAFVCEYRRDSSPTTSTTPKPTQCTPMHDCYDWLHIAGQTKNGLYIIHPPTVENAFIVYCDMTTEGGGWTLFHRRQSSSLAFEHFLWNDYKLGFQNDNYANYWMGLDRLHAMTTNGDTVDLRIEIFGDRNPHTDCANCTWNLTAPFKIGNELTNYKLELSSLAAGSAIRLFGANGMQFTTADRDHDANPTLNCAQVYHSGGWWFGACFGVNLNGKYDPTGAYCPYGQSSAYSYCWYTGDNTKWRNPKTSEMKLRKRVVPSG